MNRAPTNSIKLLLAAKAMTIRDLATKTGLSYCYTSNLISGCKFSTEGQRKIEAALGMKPGSIWSDPETTTPTPNKEFFMSGLENNMVTTPRDVMQLLPSDADRDGFYFLLLNWSHNPVGWHRVDREDVGSRPPAQIAEYLKRAFAGIASADAAAVILASVRSSAYIEPWQRDLAITAHLVDWARYQAAKPLLDHVIISGNRAAFHSMRRHNDGNLFGSELAGTNYTGVVL